MHDVDDCQVGVNMGTSVVESTSGMSFSLCMVVYVIQGFVCLCACEFGHLCVHKCGCVGMPVCGWVEKSFLILPQAD